MGKMIRSRRAPARFRETQSFFGDAEKRPISDASARPGISHVFRHAFCVPDSYTFWRNRVFGPRKPTERAGIRIGNATFFRAHPARPRRVRSAPWTVRAAGFRSLRGSGLFAGAGKSIIRSFDWRTPGVENVHQHRARIPLGNVG
jgi:hypothetical protein